MLFQVPVSVAESMHPQRGRMLWLTDALPVHPVAALCRKWVEQQQFEFNIPAVLMHTANGDVYNLMDDRTMQSISAVKLRDLAGGAVTGITVVEEVDIECLLLDAPPQAPAGAHPFWWPNPAILCFTMFSSNTLADIVDEAVESMRMQYMDEVSWEPGDEYEEPDVSNWVLGLPEAREDVCAEGGGNMRVCDFFARGGHPRFTLRRREAPPPDAAT